MTRMISMLLAASLLGGCSLFSDDPPVAIIDATCEALRPDMPVLYHSRTDHPDTVARIRRANARYAAVCP